MSDNAEPPMVSYETKAIKDRTPDENAAFGNDTLSAKLDALARQGKKIIPLVLLDATTNTGDRYYITQLALDDKYKNDINRNGVAGVLVTDPATLQHDLGFMMPANVKERMIFIDTEHHKVLTQSMTVVKDFKLGKEDVLIHKEAYLALKDGDTLAKTVEKIEQTLAAQSQAKAMVKDLDHKGLDCGAACPSEGLSPSAMSIKPQNALATMR